MSKFTILVGESSSGKDAILQKLVKDYGYVPMISATTRPQRVGEKNGVSYYFVSNNEFKVLLDRDEMIEYRTYHTLLDNYEAVWYYGLPKMDIDKNVKNYVVVLDLTGTQSFIDYYGKENCDVIYIQCSAETRTQRAKNRGSFDKTEWNRRLERDSIDFDISKRKKIVNRTINNEDRNINDVVKEIANGTF